jgi:hypothetical protein
MLIALTLDPSQSLQNRLYGKIQYSHEINPQGIYVPLNNLKIEILTVKQETQPDGQQIRIPGEIVQSIHPDSSGYFTFIDIKEGIYFIRVSVPNVVLMADLYLAEIRIQYINQRYSLPIINVELVPGRSAHELGLEAANTSKYAGDRKWDWRIYIVAPRKVIDSIECVEYTLHKTFRKRVWKICRDENFNPTYPFSPPVFRGWGVFNVPIKIIFIDGKICYLNHMLVFDSLSLKKRL